MLKRDELADPNSCINKAAEHEPVFVLRARDTCAPMAVLEWARLAALQGAPDDKLDEAHQLARQMMTWQRANGSKDPD